MARMAPRAVAAGLGERARAASARATLWFQRNRRAAEHRFPVLVELTTRLISANLLDAGTRLAAQAFLTSVPLLFVFASFAPDWLRSQLQESLRTVFGLTGGPAEQLQQVLGHDQTELQDTVGIVGALMVLISATSFSRAMSRVCQRAWQLPKAATTAAAWRWIIWLFALLVVLVFQGPLRDGFGVGSWLGTPLTFLVGTASAWWTQHLLLVSRVRWLPLLPGAILTSAAITAITVTARLYMPRWLSKALTDYGSLGGVLTLLSWLIALCAAATFAITIGAVLAQGPPLNRFLGTDAAAEGAAAAGNGASGNAAEGDGADARSGQEESGQGQAQRA